jgi:hypothetical protein
MDHDSCKNTTIPYPLQNLNGASVVVACAQTKNDFLVPLFFHFHSNPPLEVVVVVAVVVVE